MREFSVIASEAFSHGLRPRERMRGNAPYLKLSESMFPFEEGLRDSGYLTDPFGSSSVSWPWPQCFRGRERTILVGETSLSQVAEFGEWNAAAETTYDLFNKDATLSIPDAGGCWHLADFGPSMLLTKGNGIIVVTAEESAYGATPKFYTTEEVPVASVENYNGQLVLGGFSFGHLWTDHWDSVFDAWLQNAPVSLDFLSDAQDNMVFWGEIGGGSLLDILDPPSPERLIEILRRGELGFMPMPWSGSVHVVKQLGNRLMVYGDGGITWLTPHLTPVQTFGLGSNTPVQVAGRGAVGASPTRHIVLDARGDLWEIPLDGGMRILGYREFLRPMVGQEMLISWEPSEDAFFISGEDENSVKLSYVLSKQGLGQAPQRVTSAWLREAPEGILEDIHTGYDAIIELEKYDFGVRDFTTVTTVEVGINKGTNAWVADSYRYGPDEDFVDGPWVPVNKQGFARIQKTASEHCLRIKLDDYRDAEIDSLIVHYQRVGKRTIRGPSASQIDS